MRLSKHILSPMALNPRDFEANQALVDEICKALGALRDSKDYIQVVIFLMRITGVPLSQIMSTTDLGPSAVEQRLRNLCDLAAFLDVDSSVKQAR